MSLHRSAGLWRLNHRVLTGVLNDCAQEMGELGLEAKEFFVLAEIDECSYPADLATRLVIPKATLTVYLRNLEQSGLVARDLDRRDLRRHKLALTPEGREVLDRALTVLSDRFDRWLDRLAAQERVELERLLDKLVGHPEQTAALRH